MPRWGIGWDVFCWVGQRRFSAHWSVPQIRHELADSYDILLSDDGGRPNIVIILADYFDYYHNSRLHLSLDRNSPTPREVALG